MTNQGSAPAEQANMDPFTIFQAEINVLEPLFEAVPLDVLETETPYPVSRDFAKHMGSKRMPHFNASYVRLSQELSRVDLIDVARKAVSERKIDDTSKISETAQKRAIFAKGFSLSLLDRDERRVALGESL